MFLAWTSLQTVKVGSPGEGVKKLQALWTVLMPAFAPLEAAEELMQTILVKCNAAGRVSCVWSTTPRVVRTIVLGRFT